MIKIVLFTAIMFVVMAAFAGILYLVKVKYNKKTGCCGKHSHCQHR